MTFSFRTLYGEDKTFPIERLHQVTPAKNKAGNPVLLVHILKVSGQKLDDYEHLTFEAAILQIDQPNQDIYDPNK